LSNATAAASDLLSLNISIPFRQSASVAFEQPIKHYIETRYGQDFGDYVADANALEKMRALAIQATDPHVSAIKKIQAYAAQLVWLEARFPIDVSIWTRIQSD
jgi:programmed cell death 6-interacting protein